MAIQPNPQAKPATEVETTHVDGDGGADTTAVAGAHVDTGVHDAGDKCPRCHKASHFQPPTFLDPGYNAAGHLMPFSEMSGIGWHQHHGPGRNVEQNFSWKTFFGSEAFFYAES